MYKKWWVWLIAIIIIVGVANGCEETTSTQPKEDKKAKKEEVKKEFGIGEEVNTGKLSYKVNGVKETNRIPTYALGDITTEGKFVTFDLTVVNNDKEPRKIVEEMLRILGADGTEYAIDGRLFTYYFKGESTFTFHKIINPKLSYTGKVVFELPSSETAYSLKVSSGFGWSDGNYEIIKIK